jgi:hypothetical protein
MNFLASRFVFLVLSLVSCAICVAIPQRTSAALHFENHQKRNDGCGFSGNSDLYGLGIRLGVYFQWASTLIIYGWYPEGRNDLVESYLAFLVAITIAIIVITAQTEPTYAAEILVLAYIIFGGIYTVMMVGARQHHRKRIETSAHTVHWAQTFALLMILASAGIYYSWFWLHGIHHNVLETTCGTFGFLFTKVSLYNPSVYKFLAAASIWVAGLFAYSLAYALVLMLSLVLRVPRVVKKAESWFPTPRSVQAIAADGRENHMFWFTEGISLFSLAYSVIGIEMTLYWNSISDVYTINTTGQLIPFVIGLVGLAKVTYEPIKMVRCCTTPYFRSN